MDSGAPKTSYSRITDGITPARSLPCASAALASGDRWDEVLDAVIDQLDATRPDLAFIYASPRFAEHFPALAQAAWEQTGASLMAGASTTTAIANGIEAENQSAIAMVAMSLPGAILRPARLTQSLLDDHVSPAAMRERLGIGLEDVNGWILLADGFRLDADRLVEQLSSSYPGAPVVGGLATPAAAYQHRSWVFLNGSVYADGGAGIAIGGDYDLVPIMAHGCEPIGETWTITGAKGEWIETISNRPALSLLGETLEMLPSDVQEEAESNLVAGFAANEYQDRFARGDFLIRSIKAVDWERGAIAVAARPRVGQTIQFHIRDAATASLDLTLALSEARNQIEQRAPVAALIHASNSRGTALFGVPDHDATELARRFPGLPHGGMVSAGEFGPGGKRSQHFGLTASIGLITTKPAPDSGTSPA